MSQQALWSILRQYTSLCPVLLCACGPPAIRGLTSCNKYPCFVCFFLTVKAYILPEQHTKGRMGHIGYLIVQALHYKGASHIMAYRLHLPSSSQTGHQYPVWLQLRWLSCKWSANPVFYMWITTGLLENRIMHRFGWSDLNATYSSGDVSTYTFWLVLELHYLFVRGNKLQWNPKIFNFWSVLELISVLLAKMF